MHRRDFLRFLLAAPIAATVDVEKLLWVPGEKTIFLPPAPVIWPGTYGAINGASFAFWRTQQLLAAEVEGLNRKELLRRLVTGTGLDADRVLR